MFILSYFQLVTKISCIYYWINCISVSFSITAEKAMVPHSSTFAWKIPCMKEPGGLQSVGLHSVRHDWVTSLSTFHFHALEKEMATHSSVLAWRIPGMAEPGGLPSMRSHRVGHDWHDLAAAAAALLAVSFVLCYSYMLILNISNKVVLVLVLSFIKMCQF